MSIEVQDRDAIVSRAIAIASAEERDAYIARACGDDAALRREVDEMVAAHFRNGKVPGEPAVEASAGASPRGQDREPAEAHQADHHEDSGQATPRLLESARTSRRALVIPALLVLGAVAGRGTLAVWAPPDVKEARASAAHAAEERDQALKAAAEVKGRYDEAEAERQALVRERDEAVEGEQAAERSAQDTKAVVAFLQDRLFSAGRPRDFAGGLGKDVTLRQAVEVAEAEVAKAFADRPLAEASVRQALGSAYVDLAEAALAVKQLERALALREAVLGPDIPATVDSRNKLAVAYRLAGRHAEASRLYDQNPESPSHADALAVQGSALLSQKKPAEAELKLRQCLAVRQKVQPDDWATFETKSLLGEALCEQKKYAEAEPLLLSGYEGFKQRLAKAPAEAKPRLTRALERLVRLYETWDKKGEAARWRKELDAAEGGKKA
jgi:hypothetical protein